MNEDSKLLAWFLGPKAENASLLEEMLLLLLRDYCHWRRNYFPGDRILVTRDQQRELESHYDKVHQNLLEITAELRRNFPFYSPRYMAHMLSDTLLPSIMGYISGMLYNPNNVTPEAAPVTVDMEIEACNALLEMLGFNPPPEIPNDFSRQNIDNYKRALKKEFGWAHLTLGGTTANLEALWVARTVRYTPLSIWDVAKQEGLDIEVKLPSGQPKDIRDLQPLQLILLKPNEAIYLLARYVDSYRRKHSIPLQDASDRAYRLLQGSQYGLNRGIAELFQQFPPTLLVSGTAHYSIQKAADILGIGKDNIQMIKTDSSFRMDVAHLRVKLEHILAQNRVPLAVIPVLGSTEEGAVDPVHRILDLRQEFEEQRNTSFWIHVDAAWGGYIRSIFNLALEDETEAILSKISRILHINFDKDIPRWNQAFFNHADGRVGEFVLRRVENTPEADQEKAERALEESIKARIKNSREKLAYLLEVGDLKEYRRVLRRFVSHYPELGLDAADFDLTLEDRIDPVCEFVRDDVSLHHGEYHRDIEIRWGQKEVCCAFVGLPQVDSITVDPHKMGYVNYPCGTVAFRNDRVRHFILQKAPYITSVRQDVLVHMPPRHIEGIEQNPKVYVEAFAPFIVEGSRPGAAAASLWLTVKTIPPTMKESGVIVKASLLAARELHEWLIHWDAILRTNRVDVDYQFVPLLLVPPDTNIVIFAIKKRTSNSLLNMNKLTELVYDRFTIQAELGDREYSYAQPYFLSKTVFGEPAYPFETVKAILERHFDKGYMKQICDEYRQAGLTVLRATLMNPYISLTRQILGQNVLKEFMLEMSEAAAESVRKV